MKVPIPLVSGTAPSICHTGGARVGVVQTVARVNRPAPAVRLNRTRPSGKRASEAASMIGKLPFVMRLKRRVKSSSPGLLTLLMLKRGQPIVWVDLQLSPHLFMAPIASGPLQRHAFAA